MLDDYWLGKLIVILFNGDFIKRKNCELIEQAVAKLI